MRRRAGATLCILISVAGCATSGGQRWGFDAPTLRRVGRAAVRAAISPQVLAPTAGALVLQIDNWDHRLSRWASDDRPIFGSEKGARNAGDALVFASLGTAGVAAAAVPTGPDGGYSWDGKLLDFAASGAAIGATAGITDVLEHATGRERPHGGQTTSFPSSHASTAAAANMLTQRYVERVGVPDWAKYSMDGALILSTYATGWARVEARRHFPSDVLAGIAIGSLLGGFTNELLDADLAENVSLSAGPYRDGAGVFFSIRW